VGTGHRCCQCTFLVGGVRVCDEAGIAIRGSMPTAMDAFSRHKQLMTLYRSAQAPPEPVHKTDADVLREEHRFLRDDDEVEAGTEYVWGEGHDAHPPVARVA
jgi:hypothetical protein